MSRKFLTRKRFVSNNKSFYLSKLILNQIIKSGQKSIAAKIFSFCLRSIEEIKKLKPFFVIEKALLNLMPRIKVMKIVGKVNLILLNKFQSLKFAIKLLISSARQRKERTFQKKLVLEMLDAFDNKGLSIRRKNDVYASVKNFKIFKSKNLLCKNENYENKYSSQEYKDQDIQRD